LKKIIVTGGAGYIGSHTVVALAEAGYLPVVIDNFANSDEGVIGRIQSIIEKEVSVHKIDCTDESAVKEAIEKEGDIAGIIHFAAHKAVSISVERPLAYYRNNVGALISVMKSVQSLENFSFVFSSSATVYGQPDSLPVSENSPFKLAESPYGRTKQICESIITDVIASGLLMKAVTLRYFNPIGAHPSGRIGELPRGKPENLIPYLTQTAVGKRTQLTVFGDDYDTPDGTCIRDYIHVVDLARAHVLALDWMSVQCHSSFNEVFNVGSGYGTSVLDAIRAFEKATGISLNYRIGDRRIGDVAVSYADVSKAKRCLGYFTRLSLEDAMRDAYNWQLKLNCFSR